MQNLSIDFGHSTVKGASANQRIIYPSIISSDVKSIEMTEFTDYDPLNFIKIKYNGQQYFIGDLARRHSDLCIQNCNNDDLTTWETKTLILTAAAYMLSSSNSNRINIATDLPVSHFAELKNNIKQSLLSLNHMIVIELYDFQQQKWIAKTFYIDNVEIQKQGFYSLMQVILNDDGSINPEKKSLMNALNVIVDIGYFSTDILILNQLEPIEKTTVNAIPGMVSAYRLLQQILYDKFGVRKELHEIEPYFVNRSIRIGGKTYDITDAINNVLARITAKITAEINNLIPFWAEVDNWLLCGGGSIPLYEDFQTHYKNITQVPDPQMSNALGGLKWARRKFK